MSGSKTVSVDLARGTAVARAEAARSAARMYGRLPGGAVGVAVIADRLYYWVKNDKGRLALEAT